MKIVAVTSCPTGIAHTYMAAESLEEAAREAGHSIAVETQGGASIVRRDTATTYGGGLTVSLFRNGVLTALVSRTRYESNVPQFNRSVFRFTTGFSLEGEIPR